MCNSLQILLDTCAEFGIPVAAHKCTDPTCLVFLGILIDTIKMQISLPEEKLQRLKGLLLEWKTKKCYTRTELESLIGHLQHAAKVVRPGRRFIMAMLSFLRVTTKSYHHIWLNKGFRADLLWWLTFVSPWNGVSMLCKLK